MQTIEQENANLLRNGYPPLADCETLHTPGPWEIGSINKRDKNLWWAAVFTPKSTGKFHTPRACEALGVDREECEGNARLIAAAPDMFDALRAIVDAFGDQDSLLIDQAKAAIAKAEGRAE